MFSTSKDESTFDDSKHPSPQPQPVESPNYIAFKNEIQAFIRFFPELMEKCPGWTVGIYHGAVVDKDKDGFELSRRIRRKYGKEFVLIKEVSIDTFRGFCIETPEEPHPE